MQGVRRLGAAAVDMSHVALGIVEAYWEYRLKPWDMAAGVLVILYTRVIMNLATNVWIVPVLSRYHVLVPTSFQFSTIAFSYIVIPSLNVIKKRKKFYFSC